MSEKEKSFFDLSTKEKFYWTIFAPFALFRINNELCLVWIISSILLFMLLNIYTSISKPIMFLFAYLASIIIVLLALLINRTKRNGNKKLKNKRLT